MEIREMFALGKHEADRYLSGITFFREIEKADPWQYELLLSKSKLYSYKPGEMLWRAGDQGIGFFFVSRGSLLVYAGETSMIASKLTDAEKISHVGPGEIVGDTAMFLGNQRFSTIVADPASKEIVLVGIDLQRLGLDGVGGLNLPTKLVLFRMIVNNIRWKLELARMQVPNSTMAQILRKVPIFRGQKGTKDELKCLQAQGMVLAKILVSWNKIPTLKDATTPNFKEAPSIDPSILTAAT